MTDQTLAGKKAFVPQPTPTGVNSGGRRIIQRYWHWAVVVLLAIILWAPRLSGPIDLRWDGGVYYLLGTSLATGHGYRSRVSQARPKRSNTHRSCPQLSRCMSGLWVQPRLLSLRHGCGFLMPQCF